MKKEVHGMSTLSYRMRTAGDNRTHVSHTSSYTYVCPNCNRRATVETKTVVNLEVERFSGALPREEDSKVYINPTEGISVSCPCGCGMIPVDTISANFAVHMIEKYNFKGIILPDPINDTGMGLVPSELSFMDPFTNDNMQRLISVLKIIDNTEAIRANFMHIVVRVVSDMCSYSYPLYIMDKYSIPKFIKDEAYIYIQDINSSDLIRNKRVSAYDEFSAYMHIVMDMMDGKKISDVIEELSRNRTPF